MKNPEELKHALRIHCGMIVEGSESNELDEFRTAKGVTKAPATTAVNTNIIADKVDEVPLSAKKVAKAVVEDDASLADDEFLKELEGI